MLAKFVFFFITISLLFGCSSNNHEEKLAELDKVYGKCDNPHRQLRPLEYEICKDKEAAAGPDGVIDNEGGMIDGLFSFGNDNSGAIYATASDTNNFLWDASLQVLDNYSLKISDFDGGYIETNWIQNVKVPNQRCLVKSHVTSKELISTGIKIKILCENLFEKNWYVSDEEFYEEEKQLTLKILQVAKEIKEITPQS